MAFWPGQSFRTPVSSHDTGKVQLAQQQAEIIGELGKLGTNIYLKHEQNKLSTAQIEVKAAEAKLAEDLGNERDPEKFQAILEKHNADVFKLRPKGGGPAAQEYDLDIASKQIDWQTLTNKAKENRVDDIAEVNLQIFEKKYIETGVPSKEYLELVSELIADGWDESEMLARVEKVGHLADRKAMATLASNNPEWVIKNLATQADMKKHYPNSIPEDHAYILGLARGQKGFNEQQNNALMSAFYTDVSDKAEKGMPLGQLRDLIRNQPGLTVEERKKAMTVANSAYSTWDEGGTKENSWKTTQDYNALMKMQIKISAGLPVSELDIIDAQMAQPSKGPLFSNSDRNNLFSQLPDNKDPIMKTPFAEEWMNIVDSSFATEKVGKDKVVPEDQLAEWQATRNTITAIIKENGLNYTKAQSEIKEALAPIRKKKANKTLSKIWGFATTSPLGTAIKIGKMQLELSKAKEQNAE